MTAGIIFVISILILGGLIAVVSDRLGMKVGKARLSLFKMRPRQTAAVVTIVTGTVLSGLTLGIMFTASKPLRRGVFKIDQIQERLNQTRKDLTQTTDERDRVQRELALASSKLKTAQTQFRQINESLEKTNTEAVEIQTELEQAQQQLQQAESQLSQLQQQLDGVETAKAEMESELNQTEDQLQQVSQQKQTLQSEIEQLKTERQKLIQQREEVQAQIQQRDQEIQQKDEAIEERDQEIKQRDRIITQREETLQNLETERQNLEQQTAVLKQQLSLIGRNLKLLREGSVGLKRGQILASGLVKTQDKEQSKIIVNRILQAANQRAIDSVQLGNMTAEKERVIQIPTTEVEALIDEIDDGRDYVIQVVSSANYLVGEKRVDVFTKVEPNRLLFTSGEVIAKNSINPAKLTDDQLQQRLQEIIDASEFRARYIGVIDGLIHVGDNSTGTMLNFVQQLQDHQRTIELQAVAAQDTYTIGPLKLDLLARQNGMIVFSTRGADLEALNEVTPVPEPLK